MAEGADSPDKILFEKGEDVRGLRPKLNALARNQERLFGAVRPPQQVMKAVGGGTAQAYVIDIIGGQLLTSSGGVNFYGVKYLNYSISSSASALNPGACNSSTGVQTASPSPSISAWPDGLGYGNMWDGSSWSRVIIVNDVSSPTGFPVLGYQSDEMGIEPTDKHYRVYSTKTRQIALPDSSTVTAYEILYA